MPQDSGTYWVTWANGHAKNSSAIGDLEATFKTNVEAFIKALKDAGATVSVTSTKRSDKRAYLFHWAWRIKTGDCKPADATAMTGVDIRWKHEDDADDKKSIAGAGEMVTGFGLAVPPSSKVAPSLTSNHISGKAIDMTITWKDTIKVKQKDGTEVSCTYSTNVNGNTNLHTVGESYSVKKHKSDAPHWSVNGR